MVEPANIVYIDLPEDWGKPYSWHADLNLVQLDRRLEFDAEGRERALDALQAEWRSSLRLVRALEPAPAMLCPSVA